MITCFPRWWVLRLHKWLPLSTTIVLSVEVRGLWFTEPALRVLVLLLFALYLFNFSFITDSAAIEYYASAEC